MKNQRIICYFLIELAVVGYAGFYGPFFADLTRMYGLPGAVLLYVAVTQIIAISAALTLQKVKAKRETMAPVVTESGEAKDVDPLRHKTLPLKRPERPGSTVNVPHHEVVESGPADVPLTITERSQLKINFELTHPHFFEEKKTKYPLLSNNEIWLLAFLELRLSTKEMAAILNIDSASVRRAKSRMQKKLRVPGTELDNVTSAPAGQTDGG